MVNSYIETLWHTCISATQMQVIDLRHRAKPVFCDRDACHCLRLRYTWVSATYMHVIDPRLLDIPAFLRHRCMSLTWDQLLVSWLYTSTLFLTNGPSWPPTAYNRPSTTPTPTTRRKKDHSVSVSWIRTNNTWNLYMCQTQKSCSKTI